MQKTYLNTLKNQNQNTKRIKEMKKEELNEIRQKYLRLFNKTEIPRGYTSTKLLKYINDFENKEKESKRVEDFFNDELGIELPEVLKNASINKSTMSNYFTPKQIDMFPFDEVDNPYYKSSPPMKLYLITDVAEVAIKNKITPKEIKEVKENKDKLQEEKFKALNIAMERVRIILMS